MMNPAALLALLGDLYAQTAALTERNAELEHELATLHAQRETRVDG